MKRRFKAERASDGFFIEKNTGLKWCMDPVRVLYADTDQAGVVYHANYLRYFEQGRAEVIRKSGLSYRDIEETGVFQPIVRLGITYESYAEYDEVLNVFARPRHIAAVKFSYDYVVFSQDNDRMVVHGFTEHACIDRNRRPIPVDPVTRDIFRLFDAEATRTAP